jgi:hypothetical protein
LVSRIHKHNSFAVIGYVLRNWKAKIGRPPNPNCDVDDFLGDLRHRSRTSRTSGATFFDRPADLSVGPVRALVSGSCLASDLETLLPVFFEENLETSSGQVSFDVVGEDALSSLESANTIVHQRPLLHDRDTGDPSLLRNLRGGLAPPRQIMRERLRRTQTRPSSQLLE